MILYEKVTVQGKKCNKDIDLSNVQVVVDEQNLGKQYKKVLQQGVDLTCTREFENNRMVLSTTREISGVQMHWNNFLVTVVLKIFRRRSRSASCPEPTAPT